MNTDLEGTMIGMLNDIFWATGAVFWCAIIILTLVLALGFISAYVLNIARSNWPIPSSRHIDEWPMDSEKPVTKWDTP